MRAIFRDIFASLDAFGKFWLGLGLVSLAAAAAMSFDFGWGVSLKHAIFLATLSIVAAFGPMAAEMLWSRKRRGASIATAAICLPLLAIEFYSHAGYTAGLRGSNIETAHVQNARWEGAQKAATEDETNVALWRKQLATLMEANAWAGTVKADGLRAQLATHDEAIRQEERRGGCGPKCLALKQAKAAVEERIAIAEQAGDLTARIEATQRILDRKRETAATTEHKSSAVDHQNQFLTKVVALVANGGTEATPLQRASAEQSVNLAMAIAGTGLPAFALFLAGLFRRKDDDNEPPTATAHVGTVNVAPVAAPERPAATVHTMKPVLRTSTIAQLRAIAAA